MATLAISIQSIERRLRGGTQALLVRDRSGAAYVAKFAGNPQGTRTLVNEWIVSRLLKYLRVSTPEVHHLHLKRGIPGDELLQFQVGNRTVPIPEGVHFGSRCPVDPEKKAIFDFLPRTLLSKVANLPDLLMAYVFDKWVNQTDARQAIFVRERLPAQTGLFRAYLIDHGLSFGGSRWELGDLALAGLFVDRSIYAQPDFAAITHSNVDKIQQLPQDILFSIEQEIPDDWFQPKDREEMTRLLDALVKRQATLHDTIDRTLRQLQQAGVAIPKDAKNRCLLAVLVLTSCMPEALARRTVVDFQAAERRKPACSEIADVDTVTPAAEFGFTAHSEKGKLMAKRTLRISMRKGMNRAKDSGGSQDSGNCGYIFRLFETGEKSEGQPVRQYSFSFNDTDEAL